MLSVLTPFPSSLPIKINQIPPSSLKTMSFASFSLLLRHTSPISTTTTLLLRSRHRFSITSSSTSRRPQNPKPNHHSQTNKNLLKAKQTFKKDFSSSSSSLTPSLSLEHQPPLSPSQAIGLVASSQANFMRVIIPSSNDAVSLSPSISTTNNPSHVITNTNTNTNDVVLQPSSSSSNNNNNGVVLEPSTTNNANGNASSASGLELLCVVRALLKKIKRRVMVGDKVLVGSIDWVDRRGMIENVFRRKNEILDPPVANVDRLLVIFSLDQPKLEPFTLTRFLVEAESTGIPIMLALNKMELVDDETVSSWKARLRSWGYEPILCSVESGHGLDLLAFKLRDQTTVIVGPSGVGKSSLINALRSNPRVSDTTEGENWFEPILGSKWSENQRVGEVSTRSGRGKHTTRHVSLLPLSGGGYLADTPGFNQPSLLKVTKQSLAQTFPEIRKMLSANEPTKCSFNNCLHLGEPGCIVKGDWERYSFYFQLLDEIRIREEFQLRTFGTKREGDVRIKMGDMGVQQAEPRLEPKKHRRQSRKRINQSILDELDDDDDDDDSLLDEEDNPILRAMRNENS